MTWHQNGALVGLAVQPSRLYRFNLNYDSMNSHSSNSATTPSNTYTRLAPNSFHHFRGRFQSNPKKWVNFAVTYNEYDAKNNDPLVNHKEHNRNFSFATQFIPIETLSIDFDYSHDSVFSETDLCYVFTATANAPLPADAGPQNVATCQYNTTTTPLYLGSGLYDVPSDFYLAGLTYTPSKYFRFNGGIRIVGSGGQAMLLNPTTHPAQSVPRFCRLIQICRSISLRSGPGTDIGNTIATTKMVLQEAAFRPQAASYPARDFHGDVVTLSVKYAF